MKLAERVLSILDEDEGKDQEKLLGAILKDAAKSLDSAQKYAAWLKNSGNDTLLTSKAEKVSEQIRKIANELLEIV